MNLVFIELEVVFDLINWACNAQMKDSQALNLLEEFLGL